MSWQGWVLILIMVYVVGFIVFEILYERRGPKK